MVFDLIVMLLADMISIEPTGPEAARLRSRQRKLAARAILPADGLPGSLALSRRRCGKASCHCAQGEGHPWWSLTFMAAGKKRVETVPAAWVALVRRRVAAGHRLQQAVADLFAHNVSLLTLARQQRRVPPAPPRQGKPVS